MQTVRYNGHKIDRLATRKYLVARGFTQITFSRLKDAKAFLDKPFDGNLRQIGGK